MASSAAAVSEVCERRVRVRPPLWFLAEGGVIHICLNSRDCTAAHHGDIDVETAQEIVTALSDVIGAARAQRLREMAGRR